MANQKNYPELNITTAAQYVDDVLSAKREPKPMESATASAASSICLKGFELLEKIGKSQPKATRASTARRSNNARLLKKNIELKTIEYLDEDPNLTTKAIAKKVKAAKITSVFSTCNMLPPCQNRKGCTNLRASKPLEFTDIIGIFPHSTNQTFIFL